MMQQATAAPLDTMILPDRVHGSLYTDEDIFQAEMERILNDGAVEAALKSAPIDAIERTGEDEYRVYGGTCAVMAEDR